MSMPAELIRPHVMLDRLLKGLADAPAIHIHGLSSDSRRLHAGDVFVALQGDTAHGLDYLHEAIAAGVSAVLWDPASREENPRQVDVPVVPVPALAAQLGTIANRWFGAPSASLAVTGVTGTNGKTTVAFLIAQCLKVLGRETGYIGTLGAGIDELSPAGNMTTPACIDLHGLLADFRDAGAVQAALEVSSHGIQQNRIDGVHFDAAVFTNLSRDHVDYHGDMASYAATKARLFLEHAPRHSIINVDDEYGRQLARQCAGDVIAVTTRGTAAAEGARRLSLRIVSAVDPGFRVAVGGSFGDAAFHLPLYGEYNVANAGAVLARMLTQGIDMTDACEVLGRVTPPGGRMQRVRHAARPAVFVDYAHTPAGLEAALRALATHCEGRLWCVFGCGGERDQGKRPMMGQAAERHA
ncbi:MAG: Mur ligase family protein, partial [Woeseiaceae bacterium]